MKKSSGITLVELLFVMVIFSIVTIGLVTSYQAMSRSGLREFRRSESSIENNIANTLIERDIWMAGYGLADDYDSSLNISPRPLSVSATDGGSSNPDTLTLMGNAIGMNSRAAQGWSYIVESGGTPTFQTWGDAREDLMQNDRVLMMEPTSKTLMAVAGNDWLFPYQGPHSSTAIQSIPNNQPVTITAGQRYNIILGISKTGEATPTQPSYAVRYYLSSGATTTGICAPGTHSLLRAEDTRNPIVNSGQPILNCVLDFQVALGLDTGSGSLDFWDNGGVQALANYPGTDPQGPMKLNRVLKQVRVYVLVQDGSQDVSYTYQNPDPTAGYVGTGKIRVGDLKLVNGVGRDVTLTAAQRNYRWKLLTFAVNPRNIY